MKMNFEMIKTYLMTRLFSSVIYLSPVMLETLEYSLNVFMKHGINFDVFDLFFMVLC